MCPLERWSVIAEMESCLKVPWCVREKGALEGCVELLKEC